MTSHCCLHLQRLFDRWHAMLDYLSWWTLWYKQIYLSGMRHSPGLLPFRENVKLFFFEEIWSKVGVRLIHECGLYTCKYGTYIHWATSSTITYYRSKTKLRFWFSSSIWEMAAVCKSVIRFLQFYRHTFLVLHLALISDNIFYLNEKSINK